MQKQIVKKEVFKGMNDKDVTLVTVKSYLPVDVEASNKWSKAKGIKKKQGLCFYNSLMNVMIIPNAIYVEGFYQCGENGILTDHAWLETPSGIIELTAKNVDLSDVRYFPVVKIQDKVRKSKEFFLNFVKEGRVMWFMMDEWSKAAKELGGTLCSIEPYSE